MILTKCFVILEEFHIISSKPHKISLMYIEQMTSSHLIDEKIEARRV